MNTRKIHRARIAGLSLVELLVAIALGGILMGGAISLFINNRATYEITNDMARLQESARFALQLLSRDIRMAGYVGCVNDLTKLNDNIGLAAGSLANFTHGIEGFEGGNTTTAAATSWSPTAFTGQAFDSAKADNGGNLIAGETGLAAANRYAAFFPASDAITVRYLNGNLEQALLADTDAGVDAAGNPITRVNNEVVNKMPNDANPGNPVFQIRNLTHTLVNNQTAGVADCGGADLFTLSAAPGTTSVNGTTAETAAATAVDTVTANDLQRSYELLNRAIIAPFVGARYFVRDKITDAPDNIVVPALYRSTVSPGDAADEVTVELVDGVQSLQILYGVDGDGDGVPDAFLSAGQSGVVVGTQTLNLNSRNDFLSVVAIKLALLLRTVDAYGNAPDDNVYDVGNERFCRTGISPAPNPACTVTYPPDGFRRRVFQTTIAVRNFQ